MSVVFSIFYFFIVITIITNVLKVVKTIKGNNNMFDNVEDRIRQKYSSLMEDNMYRENKAVKEIETSADLDAFMKSNSNPIKEVKGKRRKI